MERGSKGSESEGSDFVGEPLGLVMEDSER